jgi:hypothetical protein
MAEKTVNRNDRDTTKTRADENPMAIAAAVKAADCICVTVSYHHQVAEE